MINCRSLMYWGVVWEVPQCCHRLPGLPSQIWWVTFFHLLQNLFFCLQQKPTSYALFLHKLRTSSQTRFTSTVQFFVHSTATCRTRVTPHFKQISPEMARHLRLQISYNQSPFLKVSQKFWECLSHIQGDVFLPALLYRQYELIT